MQLKAGKVVNKRMDFIIILCGFVEPETTTLTPESSLQPLFKVVLKIFDQKIVPYFMADSPVVLLSFYSTSVNLQKFLKVFI